LFPNQGWNSGPWQGQHRTLTTGLSRDEMVGWHHQLDANEFEYAPGVSDG